MIFSRNQKINLIVLVKKYKNGRGRGDAHDNAVQIKFRLTKKVVTLFVEDRCKAR